MVKDGDTVDVLFVEDTDESVEALINDGAWKVGEGSLRTSSPVWWVSGAGDRREVIAGIVVCCVGVFGSSVSTDKCVEE